MVYCSAAVDECQAAVRCSGLLGCWLLLVASSRIVPRLTPLLPHSAASTPSDPLPTREVTSVYGECDAHRDATWATRSK